MNDEPRIIQKYLYLVYRIKEYDFLIEASSDFISLIHIDESESVYNFRTIDEVHCYLNGLSDSKRFYKKTKKGA